MCPVRVAQVPEIRTAIKVVRTTIQLFPLANLMPSSFIHHLFEDVVRQFCKVGSYLWNLAGQHVPSWTIGIRVQYSKKLNELHLRNISVIAPNDTVLST